MQKRMYWIYQLAGWTLFAMVGVVMNALNGIPLPQLLVMHVAFVGYNIALTHGLRHVIHKCRPQQWPVVRRTAFLGGLTLLISLVQTSLVIGTDWLVEGIGFTRWPLISILGLGWGMFVATSVWKILYLRITERREQEERKGQLELALRETQLAALEAQVNPHFLFNCLNSIRALVVADPPQAQDMITRLANVLRHSLGRDRQHTVPLATEMEAVSDYLALEAARFEDRLHVTLAVDPSTERCMVPPMLLQTLVENAIKHGIAQVTERGDLAVRASQEGGQVRLEVENTGQLRESSESTRLGLENARERLRLLYGDRASLSLRNGYESVTATVLLPAA